MPLSLTTNSEVPRSAAIASSSRTTRLPDNVVSATSAKHSGRIVAAPCEVMHRAPIRTKDGTRPPLVDPMLAAYMRGLRADLLLAQNFDDSHFGSKRQPRATLLLSGSFCFCHLEVPR